MEIKTVEDLRKALEMCDGNEPITFHEWWVTPLFGEEHRRLVLTDISSNAGGRAVDVWFRGKV
jgi:phosphoserine aminotransferase